MHLNILDQNQKKVFPTLKQFAGNFYLAGGTAIALQIGHRQSIDFDLFSHKPVDQDYIRGIFRKIFGIDTVLVDESQELTFISSGVKLTFLQYPFTVEHPEWIHETISTPDLLTLAALKAYTLGRRSKWKDYVDLYFILNVHSLPEIVKKAESMFGNEFSEKLFRVQLSYFKDIDRNEEVIFMPGAEVSDKVIQTALQKISIS